MKLTDEELKQLYQQQTARSAGERQECLTEEELFQAANADLSPFQRERVADHLITCSECSQEYRLTLSLRSISENVSKHRDDQPPTAFLLQSGRTALSVRALYAIAASLLVISIILSALLLSLRQHNQQAIAGFKEQLAARDRTIATTSAALDAARKQLQTEPALIERYETELADLHKTVGELSRPQINVPITDLDPQAAIRSYNAGPTIVKLPNGANLFMLILNTDGQQSHSSYAAEITDLRGKIIWHSGGLRQSQFNTFTIALTRKLFPAGQYRIKLYGVSKRINKLVEEYSVRVEY